MKLSGMREGIFSVFLFLIVFVFLQSVFAFTEEAPFEVSLVAHAEKEMLQVGHVMVWNDQAGLYVRYETSAPWCLLETHTDVETSLESIPQNEGNPIPGQFHYSSSECVPAVQYAIPLSILENPSDCVSGTDLFFASHATVKNTENDLIITGVWGMDPAIDPPCCTFSGKNWASYFTYTVPRNFKCVFVTSSAGTGNLGSWPEAGDNTGLEAADEICQTLAGNANVPGIYKAWLSGDQISAGERLSHAEIPYRLTTGKMVAINWDDLTDGSILRAISRDENALVPSYSGVWTNTHPDGGIIFTSLWDVCSSAMHLGAWEASSGSAKTGSFLANDSSWTDKERSSCHASPHGLYCFEQ